MTEMLNMFKCSLQSESPLTDLFFSKRHIIPDKVTFELSPSALPQMSDKTSITMTLKIMVQKSSNKVLFAQAEENFIDFLFGLLSIPLGGIIRLLGENASVGSIGNLYKSVLILETGRYMKSEEVKDKLLNPKLASRYLCKNQIFSLTEESFRKYYCLKNPKIKEEFVRGPAMFMVTDDLDVSPLSSISIISYLRRLKIQISDVEEHVITIGIEEALRILKASLESTSALTDALKNVVLNLLEPGDVIVYNV